MKISNLLCLYGLFYSLLVHASDYKKVTTKPEYLTMHQAFIRLVHNNPDKSLDDLEHAVYKAITPMKLYTNVMMLKQQKTENFEDKKCRYISLNYVR